MTAAERPVAYSIPQAVPVALVRPTRSAHLRAGTASDNVVFDGDDDADTVHLVITTGADAVSDPESIVAISTWMLRRSPDRPDVAALQLRGMAVHGDHRSGSLGSRLITAGVELARQRSIAVLWANARDSALAFYERNGFTPVGDGFITADTKLPHHRIVRDLD